MGPKVWQTLGHGGGLYIHIYTMGMGPGVWQTLGRDGGWMGGKLRANFFVKCPDGGMEGR